MNKNSRKKILLKAHKHKGREKQTKNNQEKNKKKRANTIRFYF